MTATRRITLQRRPVGLPTPDVFALEDSDLPEPAEGEFRIRIDYISLDPAMRGWINEGKSYVPPVGIGDVMRSFSAGIVESSRHPDYKEGDAVTGLFGVQTRAISDGENVLKVDTAQAPLHRWIGGLGMPGTTAYFGLKDIGKPKPGETVLVSAASGAVGGLVGQIAKIEGCRVVGIAGGAEKCAHLTDKLGFDAAVDHRADDFREQLKAATPDGVDIYFENVGGDIFDAALGRMNPFGRIPVCGMISLYNSTEPPPPIRNIRSILVNRLTVRGFIVFDFRDRYPEAAEALGRWHADGKLIMTEDVREGGIESFPETLNELFSGGNFGKLILKF